VSITIDIQCHDAVLHQRLYHQVK